MMDMPDYTVYIKRLEDLRQREETIIQQIGHLKNKRRRKHRYMLEELQTQLRSVREQSANLCAMLDKCRENKEDKIMLFLDENPQIYNEVIGVCYRKAILWRDDEKLFWFDCDESTDHIAIGDSELDDGLLFPFSDLPAGERKMILSYLIEAGSTPVHYLTFLEEMLKNTL